MFKIGDIVVSCNLSNSNNGFVFKILLIEDNKYYVTLDKKSKLVDNCFRKATEDEIKWFEAGITNINQIPEIGGFYINNVGNKRTITELDYDNTRVICNNAGINIRFKTYINDYIKTYKPPIKSQHVGNEVPINTPFEVGDLKNCKIGNLTPEDHKIIQPWLFSLGYKWNSGTNLRHIDQPYLCTTGDNYIFKKSNKYDYNTLQRTEIKKETILNYIKQLNTNKNYEQINKRTEIKPINRRVTGRSISIPTIAGSITSASRLIGNKASGKCIKSHFRSFKISENIITC